MTHDEFVSRISSLHDCYRNNRAPTYETVLFFESLLTTYPASLDALKVDPEKGCTFTDQIYNSEQRGENKGWNKAIDRVKELPLGITPYAAAIITLYTGSLLGKFETAHALAEEVLGRPVMTHELADSAIWVELKEKVKPLFIQLSPTG